MAITFSCEGCGKQYTVKDELAGKRAQCKKCNAVMMVPRTTQTEATNPPRQAAAREPDLRDETVAGGTVAGRTAAGTDTAAGTVHSLHGESLSGRSISGSVAGKSLSGRSMAGGSASGRKTPADVPDMAAAPGSDQYSYADAYRAKMQAKNRPAGVDGAGDGDVPSLEALKHVAASKQGALDYAGDESDVARRVRGPAAKNYASTEPISFLLTVVLIGTLAYAVFGGAAPAQINPQTHKPYADAVVAEAGKPWPLLIAPAAVFLVAAFAILGPLIALAWFGALKITNVRLPGGLYFRSVGLAAVPLAAVALLGALPLNIDPSNVTLAALIGVPVGFVVLYYVHNQRPEVAGIATGLGAVLAAVGLLVTLNLVETARAATLDPYKKTLASVQVKKDKEAEAARIKKEEEIANSKISPAMRQDADNALAQAKKDVATLKTSLTENKRQTREKLTATAAALKKSITESQDKFAYAKSAEWPGLVGQLDEMAKDIALFPSAVPPAEVAIAPEAGPDWSAKAGKREISIAGYDLTPPANTVLDLDTSRGLVWRSPETAATLTIETIDLPAPSQQRPWVAPAFVVNDAASKVVSVAADKADVEYGTVNGLPAAKVTTTDTKGAPAVVYTLHKDQSWLKCTVSPAADNDAVAAGFVKAIQSLHPRPEGVSPSDAFPAADLVARYPTAKGDDTDRIVEMLKTKPNAEDAVVKALGVSPDEAAFTRYGPLLVATATEKSERLLWRVASGTAELSTGARAALRRVDPKNADDVAFAVLDLKPGCNTVQVKSGLDTLASAEFSKDRAPAVARALLTAINDPQFVRSNAGPTLETVMGKWANDELAGKMNDLLIRSTRGSVGQEDRRLAMKVLANTHNAKYATSILRYLTDDRDFVVETLIGMGPSAARDVASELGTLVGKSDVPADVRVANNISQIKILAEIGSLQSLGAITKVRDLSGSQEVKDAANDAIGRIRERVKDAKAAANAPGGQPSASATH